jgi:hypothetical protein
LYDDVGVARDMLAKMAGKESGKDIVNVARSSAGEDSYGLALIKWLLRSALGDVQRCDDENCYRGDAGLFHSNLRR